VTRWLLGAGAASLAVVLLMASSSTWPGHPLALPRGCRDRSCVRERVFASAPNFVLDQQYDFGATAGNPASLPTFASELAAGRTLALKGVVSWDGGYVWFTDDNNTVAGTPAQNGTTFLTTSPWGWGVVTNVADATAPTTTGWTASPSTLWKGDNTILCFGYPTSKFSATMTAVTIRDNGGTGAGLRLRFNSGTMSCGWYQTTQFPQVSVATGVIDTGYAAFGCARQVGTHYAWTGTFSAAVDAGDTTTPAGTTTLWTGRDDAASPGAANGGPVGPCFVWSQFLDSPTIERVARQALGMPQSSDVTFNGIPTSCYEVDGGLAWCMSARNFVGPLGYRAVRPETAKSLWAADPTDVASWTAVGTPTITANASAGPLFEWKHANECDLVVDDDAANFEGAKGANGFLRVNQNYSASCYVAQGTSGTTRNKVRVELVTDGAWNVDGGTTVDCDWSDLTATPVLKSCPATLGGSGTSVRGSVLVGNAVADTGSITVCHCRLNASYWPEIMQTNNATVTGSDAEFDAGSTHTHVNGGKVEVCFAPEINNANSPEWTGATDTLYLHDANAAGGGHLLTYLWGYTVLGRFLYVTSKSDGTETDTILDGVQSLTHQQIYCASVEWVPTGLGTCNTVARWDPWPGTGTLSAFHATTLRVGTSGAVCPSDWAMTHVPQRYDHSVPTSADILSYREYYVP